MRELQQDPDYVARTQQRERQRQEAVENHRRNVEPLIRELAGIGLRINSLDELRQSGKNYAKAVPTLLRWLEQISDGATKEELVRTLSVPWAKPLAAQVFIDEFKKANDPTGEGLRWTIANGLAVVADDSVFEELSELVRDKRNGKAREMLALALANMKDPRAISVLLESLDDEQTVGYAVIALGRLGAASARMRLKSLTQHPTEWVRDEVRKALASIDGPPAIN
jgi:HEAT repeat protein